MKKLALLFAAALCTTAAAAQTSAKPYVPSYGFDHLVPIPSAFDSAYWDDDYPRIVGTVFKDAFGKDVRARVYELVAGPGGFFVNMIFLKERDMEYRIVYLHAAVPLWMYPARIQQSTKRLGLKLPQPADYHDVKPDRCEIGIPASLGVRIVDVWKKVLMETRYESKRARGMDGADYIFSMETQYDDFQSSRTLAGTTWSPDEQSKPGRLTEIADTMQLLCQHDPEASLKKLDTEVQQLAKRFN